MIFQESETIELKEIITPDIKKEVIAFANCGGGTLYVGVTDSGEVVGVDNSDETLQQLGNMIRDAIKPDITMFIHFDMLEQEGRQIISVSVQRGTNRPYYLAKKGLRPEGVYVRQGTSSVPATDMAIRQMIKETDGDSFEEMRALEQDLTFQTAGKEFEIRKVAFEAQQMKTLKILNADGIYTNLGLLLSEQCKHTIKAAVFEGTNQSIFRDRREFTGSLMQQLNDVYAFIDMHNHVRATFDRLLRIDTRDYPEPAVREALLNLLVHRDYAFRASGLISIYEDRIEFVSVGGLLPGIALDDIMAGLSVCRNQNLANVFYRLQLIEAYGTGMRKIMESYSEEEQKPLITATSNAFKIVLPNVNNGVPMLKSNTLNDGESWIMDYVRSHGAIVRHDVEKQFGISASTASRLLKNLSEKGLLSQFGKGRNTRYIIPD